MTYVALLVELQRQKTEESDQLVAQNPMTWNSCADQSTQKFQCQATLCGWPRYAGEVDLPAVVSVSRCTASCRFIEGYAECTPLPDSQTGKCLLGPACCLRCAVQSGFTPHPRRRVCNGPANSRQHFNLFRPCIEPNPLQQDIENLTRHLPCQGYLTVLIGNYLLTAVDWLR